jgi:YD repeat-containing protein
VRVRSGRPGGWNGNPRQTSARRTYRVLAYDALGRVTQERWKAGKSNHTFTTAYDPLGQIALRTHPTGRTVEWVRDPQGFLTAIRTDAGASS